MRDESGPVAGTPGKRRLVCAIDLLDYSMTTRQCPPTTRARIFVVRSAHIARVIAKHKTQLSHHLTFLCDAH